MYPIPGWVEHDPELIWESQLNVARDVVDIASSRSIVPSTIGITNQRETTLLWDRESGKPVSNAIVWQDRRTSGYCRILKDSGWEQDIRSRTGLTLDPSFSATKVAWLLKNIDGLRRRAELGQIAFGTVDSFLIYRLTGGRVHVTDTSNASRTMMFNINTLAWDDDILRELNIPRSILPEVCDSSGVVGHTDTQFFGAEIPISGVAGDQQAATFGQACFDVGMVKQTYGTGSFMLMNVGPKPRFSTSGLLSTIAWTMNGSTTYALEGYSLVAGAGVQWLRDELGLISDAAATSDIAESVDSTGDVYFVPAFAGLGAPYWDLSARGTLVGLTRGTSRAHLVRAVLESVAFQTKDVLGAMDAEAGVEVTDLRVDGGMVANDFLMQFQADILGRAVVRPSIAETTALGAAYLAGLATGIWSDLEDVRRNWVPDRIFRPAMTEADRQHRHGRWRRAIERSRAWSDEDEPE